MGFLTDNEFRRVAEIKAEERSLQRAKRKELFQKRHQRSDECKIDTIRTYLALGGNLALTAASTKIPLSTLNFWKASNWWKEVIKELQNEKNLQLSANTKRILDASLLQLEDRVVKGDIILTKEGKTVRKKLNAQVLHKITTDLLERQSKLDQVLNGESENQHTTSHDDKLKALAERFADLATKAAERKVRQSTGEVVDVQPISHDESQGAS